MRPLALLVAALVLSGCPDDSTQPPPVPSPPTIEVSATSADFTAMAGSNDPIPLAIQVTNGGDSALSNIELRDSYTPGERAGWLGWSMNVRTAPTTLTLSPGTGALPPGTYHATVVLSAANASNGPRTIPVTFTIAPATTPVIVLSQRDHQFFATPGGAAPAAKTIAVTNGGAGTLDGLGGRIRYWPGYGTGWLSAQLDRTTAPATLTLRGSKTGLAPGYHHAYIELTSNLAPNSPQRIVVTFLLMLDTGTVIGVSPPAKPFVVSAGGQPPFQETMLVFNLGNGPLPGLASSVTYGAGQPTGWLHATLNRTDVPAYLWVRPTTTNLPAGTYDATVVITAPGASNSPKHVPVTLTVNSGGTAIELSPATVNLVTDAGGASPAIQTVAITNGGTGTVANLDVQESGRPGQPRGWLRMDLSGTSAPATLSLRGYAGTLPPGRYETDVWFSSPTAGNSPRSMRVTLTVR